MRPKIRLEQRGNRRGDSHVRNLLGDTRKLEPSKIRSHGVLILGGPVLGHPFVLSRRACYFAHLVREFTQLALAASKQQTNS
ncbi:MAG: hypothetical protein DHS20C16_26770 [Phycisphaerae bacterium]|nr:MAG: hypothetical protein DHS20C16_26770 [Phycisphaerae bacterium]